MYRFVWLYAKQMIKEALGWEIGNDWRTTSCAVFSRTKDVGVWKKQVLSLRQARSCWLFGWFILKYCPKQQFCWSLLSNRRYSCIYSRIKFCGISGWVFLKLYEELRWFLKDCARNVSSNFIRPILDILAGLCGREIPKPSTSLGLYQNWLGTFH